MFISPIVKLLCRVLWFVLNKLLSQKSKSSPHRRRGRAVGSLRVRVRGNYAYKSNEIRYSGDHGYCGNRQACNQKSWLLRKSPNVQPEKETDESCNRCLQQTWHPSRANHFWQKARHGRGMQHKKKVHMEHESSSSSSSFFFLLKNLCRCFGAVCGAPAGRVPVLGRIHHRRTPCLCAGFGGPASRYCGAVRG